MRQHNHYFQVGFGCDLVPALVFLLELDVLAQDDHGVVVDGLKAEQGEDGSEELVVEDYEILAFEDRGVG